MDFVISKFFERNRAVLAIGLPGKMPLFGLFRQNHQPSSMKYLLLGTSGCHLCELAEELIHECLPTETGISIEHIDIAEQTQWQPGYATLIPVLLHQKSLQSLNWPFTKAQVLTFIKHSYD